MRFVFSENISLVNWCVELLYIRLSGDPCLSNGLDILQFTYYKELDITQTVLIGIVRTKYIVAIIAKQIILKLLYRKCLWFTNRMIFFTHGANPVTVMIPVSLQRLYSHRARALDG